MHSLRRLDLNLLIAFDALMRTRQVTRAADLIGIGQPGMSAALARLRAMFDDELLVRHGSEMVPTPKAEMLEPEVRRILRHVELLVAEGAEFDPATTSRSVTLRMSDLLSYLLLPPLLAELQAAAPGLVLEIVHLDPARTVDALERNVVELAVSTQLDAPPTIESTKLFADKVVGLARVGHPSLRQASSLDAFVSMPQVKVAQSPIDQRFADHQLARLGLRRHVAVTVPHWLVVPRLLATTDLLAIVPESFAVRVCQPAGLTSFDLPLKETAFDWSIYWHSRHNSDRALAWLRQQITTTASALHMDPGGDKSCDETANTQR